MSFINGLLIIDAPASALNNSDKKVPGARYDNSKDVKFIKTKSGDYPYVSAQAVRAWLRSTLERIDGWRDSPVYRDEKMAYTDGNPILYCDDDIFGYMRASDTDNLARREEDPFYKENMTPMETYTKDKKKKERVITRSSPFRLSTFVSISPVYLTYDFGVMSRQEIGSVLNPEADPVPYENRFYRAYLNGLFSLDLSAVGTFYYRNKTGYCNLDKKRIDLAKEKGLIHLVDQKAYQFHIEERKRRVKMLIKGLSQIEGGANLSLHYTPVFPSITIFAVTKGGNNIFNNIFYNVENSMEFHIEAFQEILNVYNDEIISPVYIGWSKGFCDKEYKKVEQYIKSHNEQSNVGIKHLQVTLFHPKQAFLSFNNDLDQHPDWLDE